MLSSHDAGSDKIIMISICDFSLPFEIFITMRYHIITSVVQSYSFTPIIYDIAWLACHASLSLMSRRRNNLPMKLVICSYHAPETPLMNKSSLFVQKYILHKLVYSMPRFDDWRRPSRMITLPVGRASSRWLRSHQLSPCGPISCCKIKRQWRGVVLFIVMKARRHGDNI